MTWPARTSEVWRGNDPALARLLCCQERAEAWPSPWMFRDGWEP